MDKNDLTPEEMKDMATWFAQFFRYMDVDKELKKLWNVSPFRAVRVYKQYVERQEKEQAE